MAKARSRRKRITFWFGVGLLVAGLALLAWFLWQLFGTNVISKRHQERLTTSFLEGATLEPKYIPEGEVSALIRIPKFGEDYVVPVLEGVTDYELSRGYGHFTDTADPGQVGNYALAAHRVTHGEPLRRMPELRPGDDVIVETVEHTYTYELTTNPNDLVVPFTAGWVLDPLPDNPRRGGAEPVQKRGQRLITLTTCSELFHTDNRMIVFGVLTKTDDK